MHEEAVQIVEFATEVVMEPPVGFPDKCIDDSGASPSAGVALRANKVTVVSITLSWPGTRSKRKAPVTNSLSSRAKMTMCSAVASGVSIQNSRKNGNSSLRRGPAPIARPRAREAVALAAAEEAEIARAEKGDHFVPYVRRVERKAQAKAGEAEIDRQRVVDLGAPIVEQVGRIGNRTGMPSRSTLTTTGRFSDVRDEGLEAEVGPVLPEQRLTGFEPDVAPSVEIEVREAVRQRRNRGVERRGGEVASPLTTSG